MMHPGDISTSADEDRYRLLVDAIQDYAVFMLDPGGRVASWNPGAERFKGYQAHEIVGRHFSCFYTEEDRLAGVPAEALSRAVAEGRFEREGWRVRKDGARFWAHVVIDPILDPEGRLVGFAKIARDLTQRREAQQAVEQAQEALRQAQKMESLGQLTGGVAHHFNNLLMAVMGSLELVKKRMGDADPRALLLLDNAIQGAERGAHLTRRMLSFARRQDLMLEPVDLAAMARGMTALLERSTGPAIRLETDFPIGLPAARTDARHLEAALASLTANARDAMPEGGRLTLAGREARVGEDNPWGLEPGLYVCLSVSDTGVGMDPKTLAQATEPFFTTKGMGLAVGLGLSMAQGLAEQSGGRLHLESRPGEGATVALWLPAAASPLQADAETPAPALRVLVVDDDRLVRLNICAMLEDLGHQVVEADSGPEALRMLKADPGIDLLVSDQGMPQLTGLQLAAAARAHRPALPVILATGYADLPVGADPALRRLAKPFTQAELARAVAASRVK